MLVSAGVYESFGVRRPNRDTEIHSSEYIRLCHDTEVAEFRVDHMLGLDKHE